MSMKIATGAELSHELRKQAKNVRRRLWLASPFVGGWFATKCLIDIRWQSNSDVDVRLLTDVENKGWLNPHTIREIAGRGDIKHIHGLHAKVFIIDDRALITSANLTRTAFEQRTEIGVFLGPTESRSVISVFEKWWSDAKCPPNGWIEKLTNPTQRRNGQSDEPGGAHLKKLHSLPGPPENDGKDGTRKATANTPQGRTRPASPSAIEFHSLFNKGQDFFICNTNRRHNPNAEKLMRDHGYAAAWEKFTSPRRMKEIKAGGTILFYANRCGIIGIGRAESSCEVLKRSSPKRLTRNVHAPEWRIPLDRLLWADKEENAFPWKGRTVTFQKVNSKKYPDLLELKRYFESFAGF